VLFIRDRAPSSASASPSSTLDIDGASVVVVVGQNDPQELQHSVVWCGVVWCGEASVVIRLVCLCESNMGGCLHLADFESGPASLSSTYWSSSWGSLSSALMARETSFTRRLTSWDADTVAVFGHTHRLWRQREVEQKRNE
jgi:hypothetical protein